MERLKKLESITNSDLRAVAEQMKFRRKAGYQEALMKEMIGDLKAGLKE